MQKGSYQNSVNKTYIELKDSIISSRKLLNMKTNEKK